jgi:AcrR family transcriptional regulator
MTMQTGTEASSSGTEQRLLEAAGEVFAEYGYRAATVRQICEKAKANLAAVNYYFGDKDGLYLAALRYLHTNATDIYPPSLGLKPGANAEDRLHAFIRSLLHRLLSEGRPNWHMKLAARELIEPTPALDVIVDEAIRPLSQELESIIVELLGSETNDEIVRLCMLSVVSQCGFYHHSRAVISRLYPAQSFGAADIEKLALHVTQFSLSAIKSLSTNTKAETE